MNCTKYDYDAKYGIKQNNYGKYFEQCFYVLYDPKDRIFYQDTPWGVTVNITDAEWFDSLQDTILHQELFEISSLFVPKKVLCLDYAEQDEKTDIQSIYVLYNPKSKLYYQDTPWVTTDNLFETEFFDSLEDAQQYHKLNEVPSTFIPKEIIFSIVEP